MSTQTLFLQLDAPFAAFRWLQAGVYRGTSPVIPPSAAWGLALNLAAIETRGGLDEPVTPIRPDAPHLDIAVGIVRSGQRSTLYQQLHSYPVGARVRSCKPVPTAPSTGSRLPSANCLRVYAVLSAFAATVRSSVGSPKA